jgi:hypothetical protein
MQVMELLANKITRACSSPKKACTTPSPLDMALAAPQYRADLPAVFRRGRVGRDSLDVFDAIQPQDPNLCKAFPAATTTCGPGPGRGIPAVMKVLAGKGLIHEDA